MGKTLKLPEAEVQSIEERTEREALAPSSLCCCKTAGRWRLALTEEGIAFSPLFTNTGVLEELPAVVCWSDSQTRMQQLKAELYGSAAGPSVTTVRVLMGCLAIVDGARAAGFDVGRVEQQLEWHLKELERLAPTCATKDFSMHPNAQLIADFYEGFKRQNPAPMVKVYAADAEFSDPAFPNLRGSEIGDMWTMLCGRAKEFSLTFRDVQADDNAGTAHWEASYLFGPGGGRKVHNVIEATFTFKDGKVIKHVDDFDFWRWSRMALGLPGVLLGWSGFLQKKVQAQAGKGLKDFRAKKAS